MDAIRPQRRRKWQGLLCWCLFTAGLLAKFLAPNLKVSNGAFVIPQVFAVEGATIAPHEIVAKERRMQLLAAILTASGALGLAFISRDLLRRSRSRQGATQPTS